MLDVRDKVVLVTGGGTGIGYEVSARFAELGANLAITYSRSRGEAEQAADRLRAPGARVLVDQMNLADVTAIEDTVDGVLTEFGRLDIVINSAGTTEFIAFDDLEAVTESVWDDIVDVNLKGAFFLARAASR